ncbi:MAG: hypothetical protein IJ565_04420 [Bacilli bacterium]|nr:hypothetical protein [Bacilli bacterium]
MDNNQFNNNNQPVMNNESKKKGNSGLTILLLILVLGMASYIGYDKFYLGKQNSNNNESKEVEDNNVVENNDKENNESIATNNQETNNEIKSYLIYDYSISQNSMVDSSHGITVENNANERSFKYNGKTIFSQDHNLKGGYWKIYLVGDILLVVGGAGGTEGCILYYYDFDENKLVKLDIPSNGFIYTTDGVYASENTIYITTSRVLPTWSGCDALTKEEPGKYDKLEFISVYKFEYLGNKQFSSVEYLTNFDVGFMCEKLSPWN